jgi:hypothetical protein
VAALEEETERQADSSTPFEDRTIRERQFARDFALIVTNGAMNNAEDGRLS